MENDSAVRKIAVFASGNGTNAENIARYFRENACGAEVALIVCDRPDAHVLQRAGRLGIPARVLTRAEINDRALMTALLDEAGIDMIVLAGFLLMVPAFILQRYHGRVVNIHPSLLPKFGGKGMFGRHVHEAVVAARETETGITVHHVSEECDGGSIIFQARVPLSPDDTPAEVEEKVHALERRYFPEVISRLLDGEH